METTLVKVKETKNMVRYDAPGTVDQQRAGKVPNVYVRQDALTAAFGQFPDQIKVTIEKA